MRHFLSIFLISFLLFLGTQSMSQATSTPQKQEVAILAGGCFWCLEHPFDSLKGVESVIVGYTGGHTKSPNYEEVSAGKSGHYEAVKIVYDPTVISFQEILDVLWVNIDPFDATGQFCDKGDQYRAAIFTLNEDQEKVAQISKAEKEKKLDQEIVTEILPAGPFFKAEEYHQHYYQKNPVRYKFYRYNCGRDQRLKKVWGGK